MSRKGVSPRMAACHGLWHVSVMKMGTQHAATNYEAWRDDQPAGVWLQGLWEAKKLSHEHFLQLSMQFRSGHAKRKADLDEVQRDERAEAVERLVRKSWQPCMRKTHRNHSGAS
eukprot:11242059-Karenia_brevis.AAC.1